MRVEKQRRVIERKGALMIRRSYQEGYVSNEQKSKRGKFFEIRYRVPEGDGKWRHCSERLYGLGGRKDAKKILRERLDQINERAPHRLEQITFKQFVTEFFRPSLDRAALKPSTLYGYASVLDIHLIPFFGNSRLRDITEVDVEKFVQKMMATGKHPKTVRNQLLLLQSVFSLAQEDKVVKGCPVQKKHKPKFRRRKREAWTPEQLRSIIQAAPTEYKALFFAAAFTGARLGELLGLQWKYINFDQRELRIVQSLWRQQINDPKTEDSSRTIRMGSVLTRVLELHRENSRFKAPNDFVFGKPDGSHLHPDVMRKDVLYPILDRLQIPREKRRSGFHAFRHSAGSVINQETGNLKLAQALLGHSDFNTTANIYVHTSTESEREASEVLEKTILGDLFVSLFVSRTIRNSQEIVN
jgi:integrase